MTAFYNEPDPFAAQWLRNLIAAGHIAPGIVDERPIQEIEPWELVGFTQCHFFAGIGIWSFALRRAGWPDDRPIWTGSCPCQPFSNAGERKGKADERHLWPYWLPLIRECRPPIVLGEQVASKDGREWLDTVSADMETLDFAFGAADLCAAGFGQAHIRQRLYFVGMGDGLNPGLERYAGHGNEATKRAIETGSIAETSNTMRMADSDSESQSGRGIQRHGESNSTRLRAIGKRSSGFCADNRISRTIRSSGKIDRRWLDVDWLLCRNPSGEPSWRPVEPGTFPLAHGIASRMGKLRAYGNALDAETATMFCQVVREIVHGV